MQRLFSMFPGGRPGGALLVLRASVAATVLVNATSAWRPPIGVWLVLIGSVLLAIALVLGVLTPYCSALACVLQLSILASHHAGSSFLLLISSAISFALAVLGPGAYSLDARFFGRKRLILPARS